MFRRVLPFLVSPPLLLSCGESGNLITSKAAGPCSLMTMADAEQAVGEPVQEGTLSDPTTCVFNSQRHKGNTVTVQLDESAGREQLAWFNKERLRRDSRLIAGLGDGAVRIDSPTSSRLTFLHKDTLVTVIVASTKQKHLGDSVTRLSQTVAAHYGANVAAPLQPSAPLLAKDRGAGTEPSSRTTPITFARALPGPSDAKTGPQKARALDPADLIGTWHSHVSQGTTQHDILLIVKPNLEWSLSSMMEFDGVLNAEAGLWSLERANTFKGLGWKGTYRKKTADSFSSTGSVQATWARLAIDQTPKRIPAELWRLRRDATSVPVFQIKTVDPDLVGQWEGVGTYAGGSAAFVWEIKSSAATDLLIIESLRGTVQTKDGLVQLQPIKKKGPRVSIVATHDHGFTTTDGKTNLRWSKLDSEPTDDRQL